MGDLGDYWREAKEEQKEYKWNHYDKVINTFNQEGIDFQNFGNGHLRIGEYDFWATTGTFIHRSTGKKGKGLEVFLKKIKK